MAQRPNFKTDVHRTQTKKWADAKSFSYEGDDWGGYDEYGDYQEDAPPPPVPKTTGFRQRGQASTTSPVEPPSAAPNFPPPAPSMSPLPPPPPTSSSSAQPPDRRGSYEPGDDIPFSPAQNRPRYYSANNPQAPPPAPIPQPGSNRGSARTSMEQQARPMPPQMMTSQPPQPFSPFSSTGGPMSQPLPLGPEPVNTITFPPRKASLSGIQHPDLTPSPQPPQVLAPSTARAVENAKPPEDSEEEEDAPRPAFNFIRPSDIYKRIEEEREKERRSSQESSRASLDSRSNPRDDVSRFRGVSASPVRTDSPDKQGESDQNLSVKKTLSTVAERNSEYIIDPPPLPAQPPVQSMAPKMVSPPSQPTPPPPVQPIAFPPSKPTPPPPMQPVAPPPSQPMPPPATQTIAPPPTKPTPPPPVQPVAPPPSQPTPPPPVQRIVPPPSQPTPPPPVQQIAPPTARALEEPVAPPPAEPEMPTESSNRQSYGPPSLPQLGRMSAFGASLWNFNPSTETEDVPEVPPVPVTNKQVTETPPSTTTDNAQDPFLHEKPSQGFRSAVEHAFASNDDQSSSRSPRSTLGSQRSTEDSDVSRNSSTAGISPIMPQGPSWQRAGELDGRLMQEPVIPEESISPESRRDSGSTVRSPDTPGHARQVSTESTSTAVPIGYRRDMNPPNRNYSPARALTIETQQDEPHSETGELSGGSSAGLDQPVSSQYGNELSPESMEPISAITSSSRYSEREADYAEAIRTSQGPEAEAAIEAAKDAPAGFMSSPHGYEEISRSSSPYQREASPSKGRVRDLATKYDEKSSSGNQSPTGSISSWASSKGIKEDTIVEQASELPATTTEHEESREIAPTSAGEAEAGHDETHLRPALPGGWVSYDAETPHESVENEEPRDLSTEMTPKAGYEESDSEVELEPTTKAVPLTGFTAEQAPSNPMAAVAAAGNAIGESIKAAIGMQEDESEESDSVMPSEDDMTPDIQERQLETDTLRPSPLSAARSASPSLPPPPPPKDTPKDISEARSNYFESEATGGGSELEPTAAGGSNRIVSIESSPEDTENDRLTKDIYRNLAQSTESEYQSSDKYDGNLKPQDSQLSSDTRASSVYPREYDSYWRGSTFAPEKSPSKTSFEPMPTPPQSNTPQPAQTESFAPPTNPQLRTGAQPKPGLLDKKFSWELDDEVDFNQFGENAQGSEAAAAEETAANTREVDAEPPSTEDNADRGIGEFHDAHEELQDVTAAELEAADPVMTPTIPDEKPPVPLKSPSRERVTDQWPDAHAARQMTPPSLPSTAGPLTERPPMPEPDDRPMPPPLNPQPASDANVVPFKDIMNMKYSSHRIETFNSSREQFASMHTGLSDWLSFMVAANPDHATLPPLNARPTVNTTGLAGSVRTKFASPFKPATSASPASATPTQPYYQTYLDSAAHVAPPSTPAGNSASPTTSPGAQGMAARRPSQQMGSRGKDLLHSAGVFGGKATSGAKGLFAKGKSKFKASGGAE